MSVELQIFRTAEFGAHKTQEIFHNMNLTAMKKQNGMVCTPVTWYVQIIINYQTSGYSICYYMLETYLLTNV